MKFPDVALLKPGMEFDLVDRGRDSGLADDPLQMVLIEIRNADRPDPAAIPKFDQRLPRLDIFILAGHGPVDQKQVDLFDPELFYRLVESPKGGVTLMRA